MIATTYPPLSPDVLALCEAIDSGDDSALPILADALIDAGIGDVRAYRPNSIFGPHRNQWYPNRGQGNYPSEAHIPPAAFERLKGWGDRSSHHCEYDTPSAAYLALAEALVDGR